ncbi:hypothetical protein [Halonatronum saccharophilum]|uniref:hypothetical protein n=1 Tax=Halonatronum saccharophilum TaxID=150060 RepID=UPI00048693C7|nr:hypothetical protein [Halonatronum saccharophilum]
MPNDRDFIKLEERVAELEKKVAELEGRVPVQQMILKDGVISIFYDYENNMKYTYEKGNPIVKATELKKRGENDGGS